MQLRSPPKAIAQSLRQLFANLLLLALLLFQMSLLLFANLLFLAQFLFQLALLLLPKLLLLTLLLFELPPLLLFAKLLLALFLLLAPLVRYLSEEAIRTAHDQNAYAER